MFLCTVLCFKFCEELIWYFISFDSLRQIVLCCVKVCFLFNTLIVSSTSLPILRKSYTSILIAPNISSAFLYRPVARIFCGGCMSQEPGTNKFNV